MDKGDQWNESMKCLEDIIRSRKKNPIKIRLLMTTGCIEYWLLLHYERTAPRIVTPADKEKVKERVKSHVPSYKKETMSPFQLLLQNMKRRLKMENGL